MLMVLLVLFGGAVSGGGLLEELTWSVVLFALLTIFLVRPLIAWISFVGTSQPVDERAVIAFF
jgi:sodium/hydrogen antiporter